MPTATPAPARVDARQLRPVAERVDFLRGRVSERASEHASYLLLSPSLLEAERMESAEVRRPSVRPTTTEQGWRKKEEQRERASERRE